MQNTVEKLLAGDLSVVDEISEAKRRWTKILATHGLTSVGNLAVCLTSEQIGFEQDCSDRWLGQEIMALVGIAQFYSTTHGFGKHIGDAKLVLEAFRESDCSVELKGVVETVARSYGLLD